MKNKIGVYISNRNKLIGSMVAVIVVVGPNFFRKFPVNMIFKKPENYINRLEHYFIYKIPPDEMDDEYKLLDFEARAIVECLNTYKQFWKHDIFIENFDYDLEERSRQFIPKNLIGIDIWEKWVVDQDASDRFKVCELAKEFAERFMDREFDDMKKLYGDFGSGFMMDAKTKAFIEANADFPHTRKYARVIKNG